MRRAISRTTGPATSTSVSCGTPRPPPTSWRCAIPTWLPTPGCVPGRWHARTLAQAMPPRSPVTSARATPSIAPSPISRSSTQIRTSVITRCFGRRYPTAGSKPRPGCRGCAPDRARWRAARAPVLSLAGRHVAELRCERGDLFPGVTGRTANGVRWIVVQPGAGPPRLPRPDRPAHELSAAVRADVEQDRLDALGAECAFVAADPRIGRVRRQICVAEFAVGTQSEHGFLRASRGLDVAAQARSYRYRDSNFPAMMPLRAAQSLCARRHWGFANGRAARNRSEPLGPHSN